MSALRRSDNENMLSTMNLIHVCYKDSILQAGNHVNKILLKLNLTDQRSILTDLKVTPTKHGRMTKPYSSPRFIANCFIANSHKDGLGGRGKLISIELKEKESRNLFSIHGLINTKNISPLRPGEGVSTDGVEEGVIEVLSGKELPINDISQIDGEPCKSVIVQLVHPTFEYPKPSDFFFNRNLLSEEDFPRVLFWQWASRSLLTASLLLKHTRVAKIIGSELLTAEFMKSKDETPEFVINFLKQIQVGLNKTVRFIRTDNGTEFVNQVMSEYYEGVGIFHQKSVPRTPQQNGVVERRNRTLVEAARTMMIFSKAPMFLWAEAVATACYTQNRSLIHTRHNKTPYELVHDKKPDLTFLRVFGALCYPTNDSEDLGKFQAKADIRIFVGYAPSRKGYRIYNKRTRRLMETIQVTFDEMRQTMAPVRMSSGPEPFIMTPGQLKSGLAPTDKELEMLFQPMFDEYLEQSRVNEPVPSATKVNAQVAPPGTSLSTTIAQDAPSTSASSSTSDMVRHQGIAEEPTHKDSPINHDVLQPSLNPVTREPGSAQSSSGNVNLAEPNQVNQPPDHLRRWTKDHPLDNIVGNPSRPVSTRKQLASDALWCVLLSIQTVQIWELVPLPIYVMVIALKWIYKVKLDEYGDVLKNKARLVAKGYRQEEGIDFEEHLARS
ncbi:putative ribonuclease H-like domain-containing protein [Tanacetum coccineum]